MKTRRRAAALAAVSATVALLAPALPAGADGVPFSQAWTSEFRGNMTQTGNTLVACDASMSGPWLALVGADGCDRSMAFELAASTGRVRSDTNYDPVRPPGVSDYLETVSNHASAVNLAPGRPADMVNSSSSYLRIPEGATVRKAMLVWGGCLDDCIEPLQDGEAPDLLNDLGNFPGLSKSQAKFRTPDGVWHTVTAERTLDEQSEPAAAGKEPSKNYTSDVDVTDLVAAAGSGTYSVGDVQFLNGAPNAAAGWSLHVAYQQDSEPVRRLAFWRGLEVTQTAAIMVSLDGLTIPTSGSFNPRFMTAAIDGDAGMRDSLTINGETFEQAPYRVDETHSSRITGPDGNYTPGQSPADPNTYGWDLLTQDSPAGINLGDSNVTVLQQGQNWEGVHPYVFALAIDVNEPKMAVTKDDGVVDVGIGEETTYTVTATNTGTGDEPGAVIVDTLPANTEFVSASDGGTFADGKATWPAAAVAAGDSVTRTVTVRVTGWGQDGTVKNSVTVTGQGDEEPVCDSVDDADRCDDDTDLLHRLLIDKKVASGTGAAGESTMWSVSVKNTGPGTAKDVVVNDLGGPALDPASVSVTDVSQGSSSGGTWNVGDLEPQESATATVEARVSDDYEGSDPIVNTAVVGDPQSPAPAGDPCENNVGVDADTDQCDADQILPASGLSVVKFSGTDPVAGDHDSDPLVVSSGQETPVTIRVTNTGGQELTDIVVADATDDGIDVTGLDDCEVPDALAAGESFDCAVTLPGMDAEATHKDTATVTATDQDGNPLTASDPWTAATLPASGLSVVKFSGTDPVDGDHDSDPLVVSSGQETPVTIRVTNTGGQELTDIVVADATDDGIDVTGLDDCEVPDALAAGESFDCAVTLPGMDAGTTHKDTATVTATDQDGHPLTASDPWTAKAEAGSDGSGGAGGIDSGEPIQSLVLGAAGVALLLLAGLTAFARRREE